MSSSRYYYINAFVLLINLVLIFISYRSSTNSLYYRDLIIQTNDNGAFESKLNLAKLELREVIRGPLEQNDPRVINYIVKNGLLVPPSKLAYNLKSPNIDPSMGQSSVVKKILNEMKNGFFIECGALDGETRSNTLDLEKNYNWKGLLIEADPDNFNLVVSKRRKSWLANACLATNPYPHQVVFEQNFNQGKISEKMDENSSQNKKIVKAQCFPVYTFLTALNVSVVDYFSLDVEGVELKVLKTIPFEKVLIKVLSVEYFHDKEGASEIVDFMKSKGYRVITTVTNANNLANDFIFAHDSVEYNETIPPVVS